MTAIEIYERDVKTLPASERLRLATLILNEISLQSVVDYSDHWTDEDLADFSRQTWQQSETGDNNAKAG